jgi:hypothetical protein
MNQALVAEYFYHKDGHLYWKKVMHPNKQYLVGKEVGSIHPTGYRHVTWMNKPHKVHRLIFLLDHGYLPKEIDHINGDRLDNRLDNLREATRSENQCNRGEIASNTSGYAGVSWHKHSKAWLVRVMKDGKSTIIGYFKDLELAGLVSQEARVLYHGKFAKQF